MTRNTNTTTKTEKTGSAASPRAGSVLVIGATGKTGRRVADKLETLGVSVRRASRSGDVRFDWDDDSTWAPALENVDKAYITYFPDLAVPSAPDAIERFSKLAMKQGVKHLVLLSGRGEDEAQRCEQIVQKSGAAWTIVRASWFNQNFSESFFLEPLQQGVLALPAGDVKEPFIDADDIADVAVAALTEDGHEGQVYEVSGPRAISLAEAVSEIAGAAGRDMQYVQVPMDDYVAGMKEHDVPQDVIDLTVYLFDTILDGRNSETTDGVQRALGRPARDFSEWAGTTAASGIWKRPE